MNAIDLLLDDYVAHASPQRAEKMEAYMKHKFRFYGLPSPLRKELQGPLIAGCKKSSIEEIVDITGQLWSLPHRECQYTAMDLLIRHKRQLTAQHVSFVHDLIITKSWWDTVDALASHLIGQLFFENLELRQNYLTIWLKSENIWLNRTCLLFQLKYKDHSDFAVLRSSIERVIHKNEFFIQKAIGWALRQHSKHFREDVASFVQDIELSNVALREAKKYL